MWETAFNVLKILGAAGALVTAFVIVARVWSGTANERLIEVLKSELVVSREHSAQCDTDVRHYRDEMHAVREECGAKVTAAENERDKAKERLQEVKLENADLRARTDLSPVMQTMAEFMKEQREFIKEQTGINAKVLEALTKLSGMGPR